MTTSQENAPTPGATATPPPPRQLEFVSDPYEGFPTDFVEFHQANPHIYSTLRTLAFQARDAGARKLGMKQLLEVCRWNLRLDTTTSQPKLNNNFTPYYARLLMANEPSLAGVFETRRTKWAA